MPTTKWKNLAYQAVLPFQAPGCGANPILAVIGRPLSARSAFERLLHRNHVLGSSTLLTSGSQETLILSGAERPPRRPAEDTCYRVASITKTATATLTMKLCEEGLWGLDDLVAPMMPEKLPELEGVTLRHLLSHTSGLEDPPLLDRLVEEGKPLTEILPGRRKNTPGAVFQYSNLGFGLLGCLMEARLKEPIGAIFRKRLFEPLGMNATLEGWELPDDIIMPIVRVLPYHPEKQLIRTRLGSQPLTAPDPLRHYGHTAGAMYTDIRSLARLFDLLRNGGSTRDGIRYLSESSVREMTRVQARYGALSPTLSYGLGLLIIQDASLSSGRILGHQGFAYGCVDGAFWEETTGNMALSLNGGASEARHGRLGIVNEDLLRWALRREFPSWTR